MRTARRLWRPVATGATLAALTAAATYEACVALRVISIGDTPGDGAPGAGLFAVIAVVALLVGLAISVAGLEGWRAARVVTSVLPVAAASLVVAHGFGFDPYYAPSRIRYPRNSGFPPTWWLGAVSLAAIVAVVVGLHSRAGGLVTGSVMLVCLATFALTGSGH